MTQWQSTCRTCVRPWVRVWYNQCQNCSNRVQIGGAKKSILLRSSESHLGTEPFCYFFGWGGTPGSAQGTIVLVGLWGLYVVLGPKSTLAVHNTRSLTSLAPGTENTLG